MPGLLRGLGRIRRTAAESADEYIQGKRDFPQKTPVAVELVTPDNVSKFGDYGRKDAN